MQVGEHPVDEVGEVEVLTLPPHQHPVVLILEGARQDLRVRVLVVEPVEDGVVAGDGIDLPLLQGHQAVRPGGDGPGVHRGIVIDEVGDRGGAVGGAHLRAGEVVDGRRGGVGADEQVLPCPR